MLYDKLKLLNGYIVYACGISAEMAHLHEIISDDKGNCYRVLDEEDLRALVNEHNYRLDNISDKEGEK